MILAIAALHVLGLIALVKFDIITVARPKAEPLVVTLMTMPTPPPAVKQQTQPPPETKIEPTIVTPPPIVQTVAPQPPVLATTPAPAPKPVVVAPPAAPAVPVTVSNLDDSVIDGKAPKYPIESLRKKEQGVVMLRLTIGTSGTVTNIAIAQSSGFDRLDTAALRAVKLWRWRPMIRNGQPIEVTGMMPIPFILKA